MKNNLDELDATSDALFNGAWPLSEVFFEWLFKLLPCPGEGQSVLFLDSFLGGKLPSLAMHRQSWTQRLHVNESDNAIYSLAASGPLQEWLNDIYFDLTNLPIDALFDCLERRFMLVLGSVSLLNLSDDVLRKRLGLIKQKLHENGAIVFLGTVRPRSVRLGDEFNLIMSDYFTNDISTKWNHDRNEGNYADLFQEAGFDWEVCLKSYPYQVWLLTKPNCRLFYG